MQLWATPFQSIKNGTKTIEMRLYDEKRKTVQVGDKILFKNADSKQTILTEVVQLHVYKTFAELYSRFDKIALGYTQEEVANPEDMLLYYPQDKIDDYGVVGIEIRVKEEI